MNIQSQFTPDKRGDTSQGIIKLAIMAVGGQGGGVLTNWIEDCARVSGYAVQATSVAGVAQRTGATIYYLEMAPKGDADPVFSLMPSAGDVDILIAAELMEAGRAILRGFVTPDKTTLIASSHRALAVSEKTVPGDGIANRSEVIAAAEIAANSLVLGDLDKAAVEEGSVISASLFGALAGTGKLPFSKADFKAAITRSGRGVEASLRAFENGFLIGAGEQEEEAEGPAKPVPLVPKGPEKLLRKWAELEKRVGALPAPVAQMTLAGLRKTVEFLDLDYGVEYLAQIEESMARDSAEKDFAYTSSLAKYLANAMSYDDVIRVADRKTQSSRFARIREEMNVTHSTRLHLTEYFHPRAEEICGLLPARMGRAIEARPNWMRLLDRIVNKGRRLSSTSVWHFLQLYLVAGLQSRRRKNWRHHVEAEHLKNWLQTCEDMRALNYDLAVELLGNRRLIKGYSDTHSRSLSRYDQVMACIPLLKGRKDAADWMRRLREAALQDETGKALEGAIKTVRSFAG